METETKEVAAGDGKRIVLEVNGNLADGPCGFCGGECHPDGFDFFIEGTKGFVCTDCVKEKAPDLYLIHRDAHQWRENDIEKAWHEGEKAGMERAGKMILYSIEETPVDRVKRVCMAELGAEDVPF